MRSPRKKPGPKPWKRVPGVVQRVHRTATEWREILARFGPRGPLPLVPGQTETTEPPPAAQSRHTGDPGRRWLPTFARQRRKSQTSQCEKNCRPSIRLKRETTLAMGDAVLGPQVEE